MRFDREGCGVLWARLRNNEQYKNGPKIDCAKMIRYGDTGLPLNGSMSLGGVRHCAEVNIHGVPWCFRENAPAGRQGREDNLRFGGLTYKTAATMGHTQLVCTKRVTGDQLRNSQNEGNCEYRLLSKSHMAYALRKFFRWFSEKIWMFSTTLNLRETVNNINSFINGFGPT